MGHPHCVHELDTNLPKLVLSFEPMKAYWEEMCFRVMFK